MGRQHQPYRVSLDKKIRNPRSSGKPQKKYRELLEVIGVIDDLPIFVLSQKGIDYIKSLPSKTRESTRFLSEYLLMYGLTDVGRAIKYDFYFIADRANDRKYGTRFCKSNYDTWVDINKNEIDLDSITFDDCEEILKNKLIYNEQSRCEYLVIDFQDDYPYHYYKALDRGWLGKLIPHDPIHGGFPGKKRCSGCQKFKWIEEYTNVPSNNKDGKAHRCKTCEYIRHKKRIEDPIERIHFNIHSNMRQMFKRLNSDTRKGKGKTEKLTGMNKKDLYKYLEDRVPEGLVLNECDIDHIIPKAFFTHIMKQHKKHSKIFNELLAMCWSHKNLRPVSKEENIQKRNKIIISLIKKYDLMDFYEKALSYDLSYESKGV